METSSTFGHSPVGHLEFENEGTEVRDGVRGIPLPDELPMPPDVRHLPKDILKSATVENLLAQNEDLMARLKVSLRRLSVLELDNQKLATAADEARRRLSVAEDQSLILREKDSAWKEKAEQLHTHNDVLKEKVAALNDRLKASEHEIQRHRKFHDRVRAQVKPHLHQLKEYARSLEQNLKESEAAGARREAQIRDLREQIGEVAKNSRYQVEQAEARVHEVIDSYEKTLTSVTEELELAKNVIRDLETKAVRMRTAEARCDLLENENVELRRSKDELTERFTGETQRLMTKAEELNRENARLKIENEDMRAKLLSDYDRLRELEKSSLDQQAQLESLRFMYANKSEENERLKLALASFEKLNIDLSQKIQEMRSGSSAAGSSESTAGSAVS